MDFYFVHPKLFTLTELTEIKIDKGIRKNTFQIPIQLVGIYQKRLLDFQVYTGLESELYLKLFIGKYAYDF